MTTTEESLHKLLQKLSNTDHINEMPSYHQSVTHAISTWCLHTNSR